MTVHSLPVRRAIAATTRADAVVRALRALWPPLLLLGATGALGLFTKPFPSALVSVVAGVVWLCVAWLFWRSVKNFDPIDQHQAASRIELEAGISELAPLTSANDRPIQGNLALWFWHQKRLETAASGLIKAANPPVTWQDGAKILALAFVLALCFWQPKAAGRALQFDLSPIMGDGDLVLDAWAKPPDYTGLPIVRLTRDNLNVSLPAGSTIVARMDGARGVPNLRVGSKTTAMQRERGEAWTASQVINQSARVSLNRFGARAAWQIHIVADSPPTLASAEAIKIDSRGRLDVSFRADDDYGIERAFLRVKALKPPVGLIGHNQFETTVDMGGEADEDGARRVFVDVGDHVLTGEAVTIEIVVRDGLGQESASIPTQLDLPKLTWKSSLGAALQEQRLLILREARPYQARPPMNATLSDPETGLPIKLDLSERLLGAPEGVSRAAAMLSATLDAMKLTGLTESGVLGLQFARERLALARNIDDAHAVAPILWAMATQAEVADQTPAQQKIAAARQALEQALKNGASDEEISQLTQEMREAIGERLNELAQQGQAQGESDGNGGNSVSGGDIDDMLRNLEQSGGAGARQDALDQLDKLAELMENLQSGGNGNGQPQSGAQNGQNGAGPLDEAMRQQRDLTDETAGRNAQNQGAPAPDLAQRQEDLADQIAPQQSSQGPPQGAQAQTQANKNQAAQAMREAAEALRRGDLTGAAQAQNRAEQALQQAAQAEASNAGQGEQDPLGRTLPGRDDGRATKVPNQVEKRRARDVREELRRRQGEADRDGQERGYLDRLLKER